MKKLWLALAAVAVIAGGIVFRDRLLPSRSSRVEDRPIGRPDNVRVVYLPIGSDLPLFVAIDQQIFRKYDLAVEPIRAVSSLEALEHVWTNHVDASCVMEFFALFQHEEKTPGDFKIFLVAAAEESTRVQHILVRPAAHISRPEDLAGKRLGHLPGTQMKMFNRLVLSRLSPGLEDKVELVPLVPTAQLDALASGQVDALFSLEPVKSIAVARGLATVLVENPLYKYGLKPFPAGASLLTSKFLTERPEVAVRYEKAIAEAVSWLEAHPDEARKSLVSWASTPADVVGQVGVYRYWTTDRVRLDAIEAYSALLRQSGLIGADLLVDHMFYKPAR